MENNGILSVRKSGNHVVNQLLFLLGEDVQNAPVYCYTDSLLRNSVGHQVHPGSTELPLCTDINCAIEKIRTSIVIHREGTESGLYNLDFTFN